MRFFNKIHTSTVWPHCSSLRPFLNPRRGLNDRFCLPFLSEMENRNTNRTCNVVVHSHKEKTATQLALRPRVLWDFTFPIHILLQDLSLFGPSKACNILELMVRIEYNKSSANLQHCQRPCYSFFVIRRYGNEWKIILFFGYIAFFSQRKILMIRIFDLI